MTINTSIVSPRDGPTNALETISYAHHEIHSGGSFTACDVQLVDATTMKWQVTTPNTTKWSHMIFNVECTGEIYLVVSEGSDRTDGAALTEINRDRNSANVAGTIVTRTPTDGSTDGTTIVFCIRSGATGGGSKTISATGVRGTNEFILKQNTKYVLSATTYATVYVSLGLSWYEHQNK